MKNKNKTDNKTNNKFNLMSIVSLVSLIIALIIFIFWPDNALLIGFGIILLFSIVAIVCGFIGRSQIKKTKEKGKVLSLIVIIIGFFLSFTCILTMLVLVVIKDVDFNDAVLCPELSECVDNGDGTSTCMDGVMEITCSTDKLAKEQFKK